MAGDKTQVPSGFGPHYKKSGFTAPFEPLYSRTTDSQVQMGVVLHDGHCNSRGFVHGGFLAALADNATGLCCGKALLDNGREVGNLFTTNLSIDYVGRAAVGEWIETDTTVIKAGRTLSVASCLIRSGSGTVIARINATFQNVT